MNALSPPVQAVLELFAEELADVRFGDVDAATLARAATDVEAAAGVVASAQAALDAARITLHERQEVLLVHAQRALAYARVYAEANEALSARLEAISLPRDRRRTRGEGSGAAQPGEVLVLSPDGEASPRRRGRPRKIVSAEPSLEAAPMLEGMLSSTGE